MRRRANRESHAPRAGFARNAESTTPRWANGRTDGGHVGDERSRSANVSWKTATERAESSTAGGTALALRLAIDYSARHEIQRAALDGTLRVESPPGGPTAVTMTLPKEG